MLLEVVDLEKHFPVGKTFFQRPKNWLKAVDGVSFELGEKEVVGLVGESGSGKSTVGRLLMRLIEPTGGSIRFQGQEIGYLRGGDLREFRRNVQMIFQDPFASLNPRKTIGQSLRLALQTCQRAKSESEAKELSQDILREVGLPPESIDRYPHQFSGGQQQRICIGRALAMRPKILICDEIVSALDVSVQAQILTLLCQLQATHSLTLFFISHDLDVVRFLCDCVYVMQKGKLVEKAETNELFENPKHPYTIRLLRSALCRHPNEARRLRTKN